MPLSVNQIDAELVTLLGNISDADISPTNRISLINRSFWEIGAKFDFKEMEAEYSFNTVIGTRSYAVPGSFDSMQHLSYENPDTLIHKPITPINRQDYESIYVNKTDNRGEPERYYRENVNLIVDPTPDAVFALIMKYLKTLDDLVSGGSVIIPREWDEPILFGAVYRGWMDLGSRENATWYRNQQINMIESIVPVKSKEEVDNRWAGVYPASENPSNPRRALWKGGR